MAPRIEKKVFIQAYGNLKNPPRKIGIYKGKAVLITQFTPGAKHVSVSHLMHDLRAELTNASKKDKSELLAIVHRAYTTEHKNYGCLHKVAYCFNNWCRGRGFHDEKYFYNQIQKEFGATGSSPKPSKKSELIFDSKDSISTSTSSISSSTNSSSSETSVKDDRDPYFKQVDDVCGKAVEQTKNGAFKILTDRRYSLATELDNLDAAKRVEITETWNEIIEAFSQPRYINKYGHIGQPVYSLQMGQQVRQYYAKVKKGGPSNWERMYLSLCGLRNMQQFGPAILADLQNSKFIDGVHHYAPKKGLNAFFYLTGTALDLYTEIDAKDDKEALVIARKMIVQFGKDCGVKATTAEGVAAQLPDRFLAFETDYTGQAIVHDTGTSNTDRGNYGIWKRIDPQNGKITYYVNTPNIQSTIPILVRLPYMMMEMALENKANNGGKLSQEFLDIFFANISTGCFNRKFIKFSTVYAEWADKKANDPVKVLTDQIKKGAYGKVIKRKGYAQAVAEAQKYNDIVDVLYKALGEDFVDNNPKLIVPVDKQHIDGEETPEEWGERHKEVFRKALIEKNLYKQILVQKDENSRYDLLDRKMLVTVAAEYCKALIF